MEILREKLTATREMELWIWDVIAASLCFQADFSRQVSKALDSEVPLSKEKISSPPKWLGQYGLLSMDNSIGRWRRDLTISLDNGSRIGED